MHKTGKKGGAPGEKRGAAPPFSPPLGETLLDILHFGLFSLVADNTFVSPSTKL